jgi:hypothetical protein
MYVCICLHSYAVKARQAERKKDPVSQRQYYGLMLKEDSDAALLRIFECFLEAAPQLVLQASLLLTHQERFSGQLPSRRKTITFNLTAGCSSGLRSRVRNQRPWVQI